MLVGMVNSPLDDVVADRVIQHRGEGGPSLVDEHVRGREHGRTETGITTPVTGTVRGKAKRPRSSAVATTSR